MQLSALTSAAAANRQVAAKSLKCSIVYNLQLQWKGKNTQ
jgi:hypothetical protein